MQKLVFTIFSVHPSSFKEEVVAKQTMANVSLSVAGVAEHYGMMFYIINPAKTSFPTMEDCPDYLQQVIKEYILIFLTI